MVNFKELIYCDQPFTSWKMSVLSFLFALLIRKILLFFDYRSKLTDKVVKIILGICLFFIAIDYLLLYLLLDISFISCFIESFIYTFIFILLDFCFIGLNPNSLKLSLTKKSILKRFVEIDFLSGVYFILRKIYIFSVLFRLIIFFTIYPFPLSYPQEEYFEQEKYMVQQNGIDVKLANMGNLLPVANNYIFIYPWFKNHNSWFAIHKKLNPLFQKLVFSTKIDQQDTADNYLKFDYFFVELGKFNDKKIPFVIKDVFISDSLYRKKMQFTSNFHFYFIARDVHGWFYYSNNTITKEKLIELCKIRDSRILEHKNNYELEEQIRIYNENTKKNLNLIQIY